jgi:hypothetical protein
VQTLEFMDGPQHEPNSTTADSLYGHLKMVESTVLETMKEFASTVINVYGNEYLRPPFFR